MNLLLYRPKLPRKCSMFKGRRSHTAVAGSTWRQTNNAMQRRQPATRRALNSYDCTTIVIDTATAVVARDQLSNGATYARSSRGFRIRRRVYGGMLTVPPTEATS